MDIDGVLINRESLTHGSGVSANAHPDCVAALNRITDETGALIVISSTWRYLGLMPCKDHLTEWGVTGKVRGVTPRLCEGTTPMRGAEVQAWIDEYERDRGPIDSFVILDDEMTGLEKLRDRVVKTEFERGLTMADAERAIAMLNG